ncbi:C-type lectin BfL-2 [Sinocyclocheilus grahami]|uniref:C-type lectin BfL-2 n=1 Tax=Sinocyclocheilus grahami TaxID=75366 RepID=UPI0007AD5322|nr:PREDICTED: C-type lectin BfL-2-like [Sinocyclocheilus grahami]
MMKRVLLLVLLAALTHVAFSQTRMFYFVPKSMSWSDAQMHCRRNYIDLATIDEQTDLDEMMRVIRQFHNGDVWTGLSRTDSNAPWVWSDQSSSTFMPWAPNQPNNWESSQYCVVVTQEVKLNDLDCKGTRPSVCYTERRKQTVRLEVNSSQNVNDPAVKTEILLQMGKRLEENGLTNAKLSWKIQPDGNVFQKRDATQQTGP